MSMPEQTPESNLHHTADPERIMQTAAELVKIALDTADPSEHKDLIDTLADGIEDASAAVVDVVETPEEVVEKGTPTLAPLSRRDRERRQDILDRRALVSKARRPAGLSVEIRVRGAENGRKARS